MTTMTPTETIRHPLTSVVDIRMYIIGGNSVFTLVSPTTGNRFTYKMIRSKKNERSYEIHLLQGDDNTRDYHFIGRYYDELPLTANESRVWIKDSKRDVMYYGVDNIQHLNLASHRAIVYLLLEPRRYLDKGLQFWTSGRCAKCGRLLTDPVSIACGFGPHCGGRK